MKRNIRKTRILSLLMSIFMILSMICIMPADKASVSEASSADPVVVVLDAGHDNTHRRPDIPCSGLNETDINLSVAKKVKAILSKYPNVKIYMTNNNGECMGTGSTASAKANSCLGNRLDYADSVDADLFVSMHCNASGNTINYSSANGGEVFVSMNNPFYTDMLLFANDIAQGLKGLGFGLRGSTSGYKGVKTYESTSNPGQDYLGVNRRSTNSGFPSVLIEYGFVTNQADATRLRGDANQQKLANVTASAIIKYFNLDGSKGTTLETTCSFSGLGWTATIPNDLYNGAKNYARELQAIKINVNNNGVSGNINYSAYVKNKGWTDSASNGAVAGSTGKTIEALTISLTGNLAAKYDVYYRVYSISNKKWLGWAANGAPAGRVRYEDQLGGLQVKLVKKGSAAPGSTTGAYEENTIIPEDARVVYSTHVQSYGWQSLTYDGQTSGTTGQAKRIEAIKIYNNTPIEGEIEYQVHAQTYGWLPWTAEGSISGTTGEAKRVEAIRIRLTGELENTYDVYYRAYCQTYGWLDWAKNGETAGTATLAKRMESIQIVLVDKGGVAPGATTTPFKTTLVSYSTHVQTYGWQAASVDGAVNGTTGKAKRLEGIKITNNTGLEGSIQYKVHCQTYGWMNWVADGELAGTTGQAKRLEAIEIKLTGELSEKYDVYYRVHCQTYGWMDWAKNGESAGSEGLAKRLEAIQIMLVPKGGSAPGATDQPFIK